MSLKRRGRPRISLVYHADLEAIVLFETLLRFGPVVGNHYTERHAALAAVLATKSYGWTYEQPATYTTEPFDGYAGKNQRKRPVNAALINGYNEVSIWHRRHRDPKAHAERIAQRIIKARKASQNTPDAVQWLRASSFLLSRSVFPQAPLAELLARHNATA